MLQCPWVSRDAAPEPAHRAAGCHSAASGEGLLESGVVASFTRPGGNVTEVYMLAAELDAKRCEILLQAVPQARTVGVLNPGREWSLTHLQRVAEAHKIQLLQGVQPADLPVEQPTRFELVANLKTAQALGLTLPGTPGSIRRTRRYAHAYRPTSGARTCS